MTSNLPKPSLPPKMKEAPLVTLKGSHLLDKNLRVDVLEIDHVGDYGSCQSDLCSWKFDLETMERWRQSRSIKLV